MNMNCSEKYTFSRINNLALQPREFLASCSGSYMDSVRETARRIFSDESKKIITLAGPSSSGKTTTASLLSRSIENLGAKAFTRLHVYAGAEHKQAAQQPVVVD